MVEREVEGVEVAPAALPVEAVDAAVEDERHALLGQAAVRAARSHLARRDDQAGELGRLAAASSLPRVELPFLFRPGLDLDGVSELAAALGPAFEERP